MPAWTNLLLAGASLLSHCGHGSASPLDTLSRAPSIKADIIYTNAVIYTVDDNDKVYQDGSIAIKDGTITWIGDTSDLDKHVDSHNVTVLSVNGLPMYPGFVDSHIHMFKGGLSLVACDLNYQSYNLEGLLSVIQGCLDKEGDKTGWMFTVNFDRGGFLANQGADLDYQMLAALKTTRPVFIQTMDQHSIVINAEGLKEANITCSTPEVYAGRIVRDSSGCPTGALEDTAELLVINAIPDNLEDDKHFAQAAMALLNSYGVTSFMDAASEVRFAQPFEELRQAGQLTARASFCLLSVPAVTFAYPGQLDNFMTEASAFAKNSTTEETASEPGLKWSGIKLLNDGVYTPPSKTAAYIEPYLSYASNGSLVPDPEPVSPYYNVSSITAIIESARSHGFKLHMHAVGDWAVRVLLDGVAALPTKLKRDEVGIAHLEGVVPEDLRRFSELNLTTIPSPQWAQLSSYWKSKDGTYDTITALGQKRIDEAEPWGLVAEEQAKAGQHGNAYGSDWPVDVLDPYLMYFVAVNRRGDPLNPHSAANESSTVWGGQLNDLPGASRAEALRSMTMNSAKWLGTDKKVGSLEVGKYADMVILNRDMVSKSTPAELIGQNSAVITVVGGKVVYKADDASSKITSANGGSLSRRSGEGALKALTYKGAAKRAELLARGSFNKHNAVGRSLKKRIIGEHTCGCGH